MHNFRDTYIRTNIAMGRWVGGWKGCDVPMQQKLNTRGGASGIAATIARYAATLLLSRRARQLADLAASCGLKLRPASKRQSMQRHGKGSIHRSADWFTCTTIDDCTWAFRNKCIRNDPMWFGNNIYNISYNIILCRRQSEENLNEF